MTTYPPIITVDREAIRGIVTRGKPGGLYMAMTQSLSRIWMGVDSRPGHLLLMNYGTFPEVIEWLTRRRGETGGQSPSREEAWHAGRSVQIPLRIEGAVIKEWKEWTPEEEGGSSFRAAPPVVQHRSRREPAQVVSAAERDEEIVRLYGTGQTYESIARELGISQSTVYSRIRILHRAGAPVTPRRDPEAIRARDEKILRMALDGMLWAEIAEAVGCSQKLVSQRIQEMRSRGMRIPNRMKLERDARNRERDARAIELVKAGMKLSDIVRETGEGKRSVSRRLERLRSEGKI